MEYDWKRKHITVQYKGIDITKDFGLCVCDNCTESIRKKIDKQLEENKHKPSKETYSCNYCKGIHDVGTICKHKPSN